MSVATPTTPGTEGPFGTTPGFEARYWYWEPRPPTVASR